MVEVAEAVSKQEIAYTQHRLYSDAVQRMANGDDAGAAQSLQRLLKIYPDEKEIQSLLLRVQLRATFGGSDYIPVDHAPPKPVLRNFVLLLLTVTVLLVALAGGTAFVKRVLEPLDQAEQRDAYIQSLWEGARQRLEAGDLVGTREFLDQLRAELPGNEEVEKLYLIVEQRQHWDDLFADGKDAFEAGEWELALELLSGVPPESAQYEAAQYLIQELQKQADLEDAWQEAELLVEAGDYPGAISILAWIRSQNPDFRRDQVEERLFELHRTLGLELIAEARGNTDLLREATVHLREALAIRPANQDLKDELDLAVAFVAGAEAYNRGDWPVAAARWEPIYAARSDYQVGALGRRLQEVYPRAAQQMIAEAKGSVRQLSRALAYLDRALEFDPANEELLQERDLISRYLEGLDAFGIERWDLAIDLWGPIYALRPGYQSGVLEDDLRLSCANSTAPDEALCPP